MAADRTERIAAIQARVDAANPLPWTLIPQSCEDCGEYVNLHGGRVSEDPADWFLHEITTHQKGDEGVALDEANGAFIAAAREDVPWLLAELAKARTEAMTEAANWLDGIGQDHAAILIRYYAVDYETGYETGAVQLPADGESRG